MASSRPAVPGRRTGPEPLTKARLTSRKTRERSAMLGTAALVSELSRGCSSRGIELDVDRDEGGHGEGGSISGSMLP